MFRVDFTTLTLRRMYHKMCINIALICRKKSMEMSIILKFLKKILRFISCIYIGFRVIFQIIDLQDNCLFSFNTTKLTL